jgi:hypothetical protein
MAGGRNITTWRIRVLEWLLLISLPALTITAAAAEPDHPRYKPSSRSPEPLDIRTNEYGASRAAPEALEIGDTAPEFTLARVGGGVLGLGEVRRSGPVVLIFYRGHW